VTSRSHRAIACVCSSLLAAVTASACLPGDDRPEPASVYVSIEPTPATRGGFSTIDGWEVRYERFVMAVGDVRLRDPQDLDGEDVEEGVLCNDYAETYYEWLFDFVVAGREKVGLAYGLGECRIEFRRRGPSDDTVLGTGATEADVDAMDDEGADAYVPEEETTLVVRGVATRGDATKRFEWRFRAEHEYERCPSLDGDELVNQRSLRGGDALELELEMRGEELFRLLPHDDAPLVFDPFAAADANGDGRIDFEELAEVPGEPLGEDLPEDYDPGYVYVSDPPSLADRVYVDNLARLVRVKSGGPCVPEGRDGR
jgi:hypothetical protein